MKRLSWGLLLAAGCGTAPAVTPAGLPAIDAEVPKRIETATLALGWFWHPDSQFGSLAGVVRTRVGYTGGTTKDPSYYRLGDHTETLQLDFDPDKISYAKLLEIFWSTHNACADGGGRQYMSAIFYQDEGQKKQALESRQQQTAKSGKEVTTKILPLATFYLAEDYHQKYMLRLQSEFLREFEAMYPDAKTFLASTAVARVNGYLGGHGSEADLRQDLGRLGLSARGQQRLLERWKEFH